MPDVNYKDPDGQDSVTVQYFDNGCYASRERYHAHVVAIGRTGEPVANSVRELKKIFKDFYR